MCFTISPVAIGILLFGDIYYQKKGDVKSFGLLNRIVAGIIAIPILGNWLFFWIVQIAALLNTNGASDSGDDLYPQATTDGAGNWVAVWSSFEHHDNDIFVATSTNNGATWTAPALLNVSAIRRWGPIGTSGISDSRNDLSPQVTTDGVGNWVAVWDSPQDPGGTGRDTDIFVATSTNNGATWTAPALLNTNGASDSGKDLRPQVTTDGVGNWVAVWFSDEDLGGTAGSDDDIFVATSTNNGATWTAPALLNTNGTSDSGPDFFPQVTTDGAGNWVAVWYSTEDLGGTAGTDEDIFVATSTNNGATWTAPALLNTNGASDGGRDFTPQVTTDGGGNWVAVWHSYVAGGLDADIFVATSTDKGATWTAPALLNTNGSSDSGDDFFPYALAALALVLALAGTWVVLKRRRGREH